MPRVLTLRLSDEQEDQLLAYMDSQQLTVASKAIFRALEQAAELAQVAARQRVEIARLEDAIEDRQQVLRDLEAAMASGLELLRQQDMFSRGGYGR